MAKSVSKKPKKSQPSNSDILDPSDSKLVDAKEAKEQWSEYKLVDGTTLLLRPVLLEVRRLNKQYTPNGDPIYQVKSTVVIDTRIPSKLKRK